MSGIDIRDAFFNKLYEICKKDKNVIVITDDMDAFGLRKIKRDLQDQFINIGVAEQNLMDVAAGLATFGKKVFVYGICSYVTARCFEQIRFSICSMGLPVTIVGVGAGFSFSFDGPTHHGIADIALMKTLPEMEIFNPCDAFSAASCALTSYKSKKSTYVRLDKGIFPEFYNSDDNFSKGFKIIRKLSKANIVGTGFMTQRAVKIAQKLSTKTKNIGVVDLLRVKPIDKNFYKEIILASDLIITLEENCLFGGIGSIIGEIISDNNQNKRLERLAVLDRQFLDYGSREYLLSLSKLDFKSLITRISSITSNA